MLRISHEENIRFQMYTYPFIACTGTLTLTQNGNEETTITIKQKKRKEKRRKKICRTQENTECDDIWHQCHYHRRHQNAGEQKPQFELYQSKNCHNM